MQKKKRVISVDYDIAREEFRTWLVRFSLCDVQDGWPCGTCTVELLTKLGLTRSKDEYSKHNNPVDRINEVWRAIIQIRQKCARKKQDSN
jgi:hypothetical protein